MSDADHNCWICGAPRAAGEHMIKKSDLKSEFRGVTQQARLHFHRKSSRSKPLGSFDAKLLKYRILCEECNTSRTQRHDRAWEKLSNFLGTRKPEPATIMRANCVFPVSAAQEMLNVHLYFVKRFGCEIIEAGAPIDIRAFSNAILDGTSHPHLYLRVGRIVPFPEGKGIAGFDKIREAKHPNGSSVFCWLYGIGCMSVQVLHATNVALLPQGAWHPRLGTDSLVIAKFPGGLNYSIHAMRTKSADGPKRRFAAMRQDACNGSRSGHSPRRAPRPISGARGFAAADHCRMFNSMTPTGAMVWQGDGLGKQYRVFGGWG